MSPYPHEAWVGCRVKVEHYAPNLIADPEKDVVIYTVKGELRGVDPETGGVYVHNEDHEDNPAEYYPSVWNVELLEGEPRKR